MRVSTSLLALAVPLAALAAPARLPGRRSSNDILVFQFANVLEQLESEFYLNGLAKFQDQDFEDAGFTSAALVSQQLSVIQSDEATHSCALESALKAFGAEPISGCQFNFDSVLTDVATMAAVARVVEFVGVGAYLGGATLLDDPVLIDAAASILTVEARHNTVLNILSGTGSSVPQPFDIPLTPNEVLAIASPFISGCSVGIQANPTLQITNTGVVAPGDLLTFSSSALGKSTDNLFCQMLIGGASVAITLSLNECVVPDGINGPVAIFITSDSQPLVNNVRDRNQKEIVAGPTIAFIDTQLQMLPQLTRVVSGGVSGSSGVSTTTQTITPEEASAIIAGATSTATASISGSTVTSSGSSPSGDASSSGSASPDLHASPNLVTGPSQDGKIDVDGWTGLSN